MDNELVNKEISPSKKLSLRGNGLKKDYNIKQKSPADKLSGTGGKIVHALGELIIVLWVVFTIVIIGWVCIASFSSTKDIFSSKLLASGIKLKGYQIVFRDYKMGKYFLNSIIYTAAACTGLIIICAPAAFVLSKFKFKGKHFFNTMFSTAMGLPSVMLLPPVFMMICKLKLNSSILSLIIIYLCTGIPFTTVYLIGFFATVPMSIYESALIDGCTHTNAFWKTIFPLAQPGIVTVTIFNFIGYWNEYIWALTLANSEARKTLAVGLQIIVTGMGNTGNYTGLFAGVVVVFVPTFILYVLLSEKIIAGLTAGSVKG